MGEFFALAAAVSWAFAVILFRRSGETVPPFSLNLFRVGVTSVLFLALLAIWGETLLREHARDDWLILVASGVIGIALSDTLFHRSLNTIGAGLSAIVDCLYSPFVVVLAFLMIGERLAALQLVGMMLVIAGVLIASRHRLPAGTDTRTLAIGILWGVLAMVTLALGIVIAKPVLGRVSVLWATTIRQLGALVVLLPLALVSPRRRRILSVFRPVATWKFTLTGTIMGSCLALLFWIAGMKYTQAGTAAILNQTTTIFILILAALFLKETFTRRKVVAALLALVGIVLVILG
jgi:drug/metabolite transporter (DMT)-like permease